jgi:hypothetical protein
MFAKLQSAAAQVVRGALDMTPTGHPQVSSVQASMHARRRSRWIASAVVQEHRVCAVF